MQKRPVRRRPTPGFLMCRCTTRPTIYQSASCYNISSGLILLYKCPHTTIYVSSYYDTCIASACSAACLSASCYNISSGLILLYVSSFSYMCLHTTLCPHTTIHVSSYYDTCVLILIYVSSYYYMCRHNPICVLILLYMCPQPPHTDPWLSSVSLHHLLVCTLASSSTVLLLLLASHRRSTAAGAYEDTYIAV